MGGMCIRSAVVRGLHVYRSITNRWNEDDSICSRPDPKRLAQCEALCRTLRPYKLRTCHVTPLCALENDAVLRWDSGSYELFIQALPEIARRVMSMNKTGIRKASAAMGKPSRFSEGGVGGILAP